MNRPRLSTLLAPRITTLNGVTLTLGLCSMCGRKTRPTGVNRVGARCHYEGAQFDRTGSLLWNASTPGVEVQALRRKAIAAQALYGDSAPIKILAS